MNKSEGQIAKTPSGLENTIAFSSEDIEQCIINYAKTVKLLQKVGFDGVQLHMAHGYLLSEFLDPFYNRRTDNYGGSTDNRYRIIHEILQKINEIIEDNFIITAKIDSVSKEEDRDFINQQIQVCKWIEKDGVDALEKGIDFISMCRPFIAEENFIQKLKNNEKSICINCNQCFEIFKIKHKRCVFSENIMHQFEVNFPCYSSTNLGNL